MESTSDRNTEAVVGPSRRGFLERTAWAAVAVVGGAALLAGCTDSSSTPSGGGKPPAAPTGTLKVANLGAPTTLDPNKVFPLADYVTFGQIYEGLVEWDESYEDIAPSLATAWEQSDDGKTWTFTLREGVKFHDGTPFDSTAVKKSVQYTLDNKASSYGNLIPAGLVEMDDSDPKTIVFTWDAPVGDFARAWLMLRVISPKLLESGAEAVNQNPVGTGPFRFESLSDAGVLTMTANDDYWRNDGPYVKELIFTPMSDASAMAAGLASGQIDILPKIPLDTISQLESNSAINVIEEPAMQLGFIAFLADKEPFTDPLVRQAISSAIDREALAEVVYHGHATPTAEFIQANVTGARTPANTYDYDPERAKELLSQAGYPDGLDAEVVTGAVTVVNGPRTVEAIAGMLKEVGINIKVTVLDEAVMGQQLGLPRPSFDGLYSNFANITGATGWWESGNEALVRYSDAEWEQLVSELKATPVGPAREELIGRMIDFYSDAMPVIPLVNFNVVSGVRDGVEGFRSPIDGAIFTTYRTVYKG